jgi:hypothetical protein
MFAEFEKYTFFQLRGIAIGQHNSRNLRNVSQIHC